MIYATLYQHDALDRHPWIVTDILRLKRSAVLTGFLAEAAVVIWSDRPDGTVDADGLVVLPNEEATSGHMRSAEGRAMLQELQDAIARGEVVPTPDPIFPL